MACFQLYELHRIHLLHEIGNFLCSQRWKVQNNVVVMVGSDKNLFYHIHYIVLAHGV